MDGEASQLTVPGQHVTQLFEAFKSLSSRSGASCRSGKALHCIAGWKASCWNSVIGSVAAISSLSGPGEALAGVTLSTVELFAVAIELRNPPRALDDRGHALHP